MPEEFRELSRELVSDVIDWVFIDVDPLALIDIKQTLRDDIDSNRAPYVATQQVDGRMVAAVVTRRLSNGETWILGLRFEQNSRAWILRQINAMCEWLSLADQQRIVAVLPCCDRPAERLLYELGFSPQTHISQLWLNLSVPSLQQPSSAARTNTSVLWKVAGDPTSFDALCRDSLRGSLDIGAILEAADRESAPRSAFAFGETRGADARAFILQCNGQPAGCLLLNAGSSQCTEIVYLGIMEQFRGQALGREAIEQAKRTAHSNGSHTLCTYVDSANLPAARLYARCGFQEFTRWNLLLRRLAKPVR